MKTIKWDIIRAEYIGGGISQRRLALKYGISVDALLKKANREKWRELRDGAVQKGALIAQQKVAEQNADNASIAARIKHKLLLKLEKEVDHLPDLIGSETINNAVEYGKNDKGNRTRKEATKSFRLRDLTAAFKDLTDDMTQTEGAGNELLQSLLDLERKVDRS